MTLSLQVYRSLYVFSQVKNLGGKKFNKLFGSGKELLVLELSLPDALLQEKEAWYSEQLQYCGMHRLSSIPWSRDKREWFGSQLPVWQRGEQ